MSDEPARIYLMAGRKAWHHEVPDGWTEIAWERFDYIECGIFEKPWSKLTPQDLGDWLDLFAERPDGWIEPHRNCAADQLMSAPPKSPAP